MIEVLGFREVDVDKAIASLKNDLKRFILTDDWSNSPLREWITKLTEDEVRFKKIHIIIMFTFVHAGYVRVTIICILTLWKT